MDKLFAYGTLLDEDLMRELTGRVPRSQPAVLRGYRKGRHPTVPHETAEVDATSSISGKLYEEISPDELARIDAYEGVPEGLYRRVVVTVEIDPWRADAWLYLKA